MTILLGRKSRSAQLVDEILDGAGERAGGRGHEQLVVVAVVGEGVFVVVVVVIVARVVVVVAVAISDGSSAALGASSGVHE